jgi:hypothetical protein
MITVEADMIKKTYIKTRDACKLTFSVPRSQLPSDVEMDSVSLVGGFNGWDPAATPMEQMKDGSFKAVVEVEPGSLVEFRYLANGKHFFNAWDADDYTRNKFGVDNGVVFALKRP